jgi:hypothetical protein
MIRSALLTGAAIGAMLAGGVLDAHPDPIVIAQISHPMPLNEHILYSQNDHYGYSIVSQNFMSRLHDDWNSAGADDFVVPKGATWKLTGVDVAGQYFYRSGPASSEVITFYQKDRTHPGKVVGRPQTVHCTDTAGNFACTINRVTLTGGKKGTKYWLSFVANCNYSTCGEWGWVQTTVTRKGPGQWENPGGGISATCTSWEDTHTCFSESGVVDDFAFDLRGTSE